jgi:hypothetical protein
MKLLVAFDYDDTWAASPKLFAALGKAIRKAGGRVVILTGNPNAKDGLKGTGKSIDDIVVIPHTGTSDAGHAAEKAQWLADNNADLLIDNNSTNCVAASQVCDAALFIAKQTLPEKKSQALQLDILALARVHDCQ